MPNPVFQIYLGKIGGDVYLYPDKNVMYPIPELGIDIENQTGATV